MQDFEKLGVFYLGKTYDMEQKKLEENLVLYKSKNLTTHPWVNLHEAANKGKSVEEYAVAQAALWKKGLAVFSSFRKKTDKISKDAPYHYPCAFIFQSIPFVFTLKPFHMGGLL